MPANLSLPVPFAKHTCGNICIRPKSCRRRADTRESENSTLGGIRNLGLCKFVDIGGGAGTLPRTSLGTASVRRSECDYYCQFVGLVFGLEAGRAETLNYRDAFWRDVKLNLKLFVFDG